MSKIRRIRIDVYRRFRVDVIRRHGTWTAYRLGPDGKRSLLRDLVVDEGASPEAILEVVETLFHEWASPDTELEVVDVVMA